LTVLPNASTNADEKVDSDSDAVTCPHGERCGGCSLLGVSRAEQRRRKRETVTTAFARYPLLGAVNVADVAGAEPDTAYRIRAKLVVDGGGNVGLYARGSHDVIDIPHCRVLSPELLRVMNEVRERVCGRRPLPAGIDGRRPLPAGIDGRAVRYQEQTGVLLTLSGPSAHRAALEVLARELNDIDGVLGVALSVRERRSPAFLGEAPVRVAGADAVRDSFAAGTPYHLATYGSFVQAHRGQAAAIAERVAGGLQDALGTLQGARVLELYAGAGTLGLLLAQRGARPLLVEQFTPALALATRAANEQGLTLDVHNDDAAHAMRELREFRETREAREPRFDAAVVNPPRRGLPPEVRSALAALAPRAIAYVSCDPETLARDLDHLARLGYAPRAVEPFDLMPLTDAVECVALLVRTTPAPCTVLYEDEDVIVIDKPPHLSTTPQGDAQSSLLERVRAEHGLPELAAIHRLDAGTSGVCLLAKHKAAVAPWAAALKTGQKHYTALARGITRDKGSINRPLRDGAHEREARTRYQRLEVAGGHSLLRVRPDQGRTHQIRRHLAAIGHPILGDARYGDAASNRHFDMRHGLDRPFLHLARVELAHPKSAAAIVFDARLAGDLATVRERLVRGQ
jgi:23S rRNA (uracil1939-C5)-methyltransferase